MRLVSFVLVLWLSTFCLYERATAQSNYYLRSPDRRIEVRVRAADRLSYDVLLNGSLLLQNSTLSININHENLGAQPRVRASKQRSENKEIISAVPQKSARIREHYNELKLEIEGDCYVAVHAHATGADGLHAGRYGERRSGKELRADLRKANEPGYASSSTGDVRRLRSPAPDAG